MDSRSDSHQGTGDERSDDSGRLKKEIINGIGWLDGIVRRRHRYHAFCCCTHAPVSKIFRILNAALCHWRILP